MIDQKWHETETIHKPDEKFWLQIFICRKSHLLIYTVADLGVGGGRPPPPSGIRPASTQMIPPLYYFEISIFDEVPYNFSKGAFGANKY